MLYEGIFSKKFQASLVTELKRFLASASDENENGQWTLNSNFANKNTSLTTCLKLRKIGSVAKMTGWYTWTLIVLLSSTDRAEFMAHPALFKWKHFQPAIILLNVRWYCRYALSDRDLEEMMAERDLSVDPSMIHRWAL